MRERLAQKDYRRNLAPGGAWWCQVELFKAERAGEAERIAEIEALNEKRRKAFDMQMQAMMRRFG